MGLGRVAVETHNDVLVEQVEWNDQWHWLAQLAALGVASGPPTRQQLTHVVCIGLALNRFSAKPLETTAGIVPARRQPLRPQSPNPAVPTILTRR